MFENVIPVPDDAETALVYNSASAEDQRKIQLLLGLRLRELGEMLSSSLSEIMDEIGNQAQSCGLTAEELESLLRGE